MSLPKSNRRYLSDTEYANLLEQAPGVTPNDVSVGEITQSIFEVIATGKLVKDTDEYIVSPGEYVKVLDAPDERVGCYEVVDLTVRMPGGAEGELKKGAWVALLPEDFRRYMVNLPSPEELLGAVVKSLADRPEDVVIESSILTKHATFNIHVHETDVGKVLGRGGCYAKALRTLFTGIYGKDGKRLSLQVIDPRR